MSLLSLQPPAAAPHGSLRIGGSKSLSNRFLILKAVSGLPVEAVNLSEAEDTRLLLEALNKIASGQQNRFNLHHAGTSLRFLCAYLSTVEGEWHLGGSARLCERPIADLVEALRKLGADIRYSGREGFPPLQIRGRSTKGGKIDLPANLSSQFCSALMLAAPRFEQGLSINLLGQAVSFPYVEMTAEMLRSFGYQVSIENKKILVPASRKEEPASKSMRIESDWSSASYWFSLCALRAGSEIALQHFRADSWQADAISQSLYQSLGVQASFGGNSLRLRHVGHAVSSFEFDFTDCPDLAPTVACTCLGLGIKARLTGLQTLQLKESRRIDALKIELMKFKAHAEAGSDYLMIEAPKDQTASAPTIETHQDHRMAMAFAPLALKYPGLSIRDPQVVDKSYPRFWDDLQSLGFSLNLQT